MSITHAHAQEQVARGADLLDTRLPGWRERINPVNFCLSDPDRCVVGQLFGGYREGLAFLGITAIGAYDYGFDPDSDDEDEVEETWLEELEGTA